MVSGGGRVWMGAVGGGATDATDAPREAAARRTIASKQLPILTAFLIVLFSAADPNCSLQTHLQRCCMLMQSERLGFQLLG